MLNEAAGKHFDSVAKSIINKDFEIIPRLNRFAILQLTDKTQLSQEN
jgi:hypothetical protein